MNKHKSNFVTTICTGVLVLLFVSAGAQSGPSAPGVKRTDLQQHDLSIPGREVVQVRVDFGPGVVAPRHKHPGEEIVYVLEGTLEYQLDGQAPKTLKAGDVLFIPAGAIHGAKNVGSGNASELATYIVEKGKPLVTGALALLPSSGSDQTGEATDAQASNEIRPFHVQVPGSAIDDLRRRILATRWPDGETVNDRSQGVQLVRLQALVRYWGTDYDWRKAEAKLNAFPQYMTTIDGVDIHFIHVRSKEPNALPVIISHGWPGSVFELLKIIGPLTDPTAYGGKSEDAFDVVIPSLPGYGFSGRPTVTGWDPDHIARTWAELMKRLGYTRYVAQGGDWGAPISNAMARQAPAGLLGIHINLPATIPPEIDKALNEGGPAPAGLSRNESEVYDAISTYRKKGTAAYGVIMGARPQAIGYGLMDSPAGLAAWLLIHPGFTQWTFGDDPEKAPTKDEVLDDISLYWLTKTATSSARLYWENMGRGVISAAGQKTAEISLPVAITVFPEDVYRAPETWARRAYRNLIYFHEVDKGGHFAAWEQPQLFSEEIRAAFRSLR